MRLNSHVIKFLLFFLVFTNLYSSQKPKNFTQEELEYLKNKKEITFCADPSWMPLEAIHNGKIDGISSDYVKIFSKSLNIPFKLIETKSWTQSIEYIKDNRCDILSFLAMETKERKKYLNFTTAYIKIPLVITTRNDITFITDFTSLRGKKIGIPQGYAFYEIVKKKYPKINLITVDNTKEGLEKVKNGELFGFIGTLASVGYLFQTQFTGELKVTGKFDESWNLAIASRGDDPILSNILQKTLDTISKEEHQTIFNKWIAIKYEKGINYKFLWEIISVALIILLIFIYWNRKLRIVNGELEVQKNKAQEALKVKSNFLANMSHEIRTPMNTILGMTYLIKKTIKDKKQQEQLQNIEIATTTLLRLINDILDSAKIESGKLKIVENDFNIIELFDNIKAVTSSSIQSKDIKFEIEYDEKLPKNFYADSLRIEQILINLVGNAIKFTEKGYVRLSVKNIKKNSYRFCIKDTGIGMTQEQLETICDRFTQADDTTTRKYGGTGLGLSISKQLVELMGGTLIIKSILAKGTEIYFDIELKNLTLEETKESGEQIKSVPVYNNEVRVENKIEQNLIDQLYDTIQKKRPKLIQPLIEQLEKYTLQILSSEDFNTLKIYTQKYMFQEASEILKKYKK